MVSAGAVQFLQSIAADFGLLFECVEVAPERPVVVITWTGTKPALPSIMLNSHMDVVPVSPVSMALLVSYTSYCRGP